MARTAKIFQRPNWNQSWRWECCYTSTALSQTSCSGWPCRLCHWTLISHNTQPPPSVALLCLPKARSYLSSQESRLSTYSKYCNEVLERNQEDKKSLLFFLKSRYCHHSVNQSSIMRWESLNSPGQHSKSPKHPSWSSAYWIHLCSPAFKFPYLLPKRAPLTRRVIISGVSHCTQTHCIS